MNIEEVKERVEYIAHSQNLKNVKTELSQLHTHLFDGELIEAISPGIISGKSWLITVTNKRVFLLLGMNTKIIDIPPTSIKDTRVKKGMLLSDLTLDTLNETIKISTLSHDAAAKLKHAITCLIYREPVKHELKKVDVKALNAILEPKKNNYNKFLITLVSIIILIMILNVLNNDTNQNTGEVAVQNEIRKTEAPLILLPIENADIIQTNTKIVNSLKPFEPLKIIQTNDLVRVVLDEDIVSPNIYNSVFSSLACYPIYLEQDVTYIKNITSIEIIEKTQHNGYAITDPYNYCLSIKGIKESTVERLIAKSQKIGNPNFNPR